MKQISEWFNDAFFQAVGKAAIIFCLMLVPLLWITNRTSDQKLTVLFGGVAAAIAAIQIYYNERRAIADQTHELLSKFNDKEFRIARMNMHRYIEKAEINGGYDVLNDDEKNQLSSVVSMFSYAGVLISKNRIDEKLFLNLWGDVADYSWRELSGYMYYRMKKARSQGNQWKYFECLVESARKNT